MINERLVTNYTKTSGSSFYYAMLVFPREKRRAIMTVYAFCRFTDDMIDHAIPDLDPKAFLKQWREQLDRGLSGKSRYPLLNELGAICREFEVPQKLFHDMIDGFEMDIKPQVYGTFSDLYEYCYRVASTVGLIVLRILGRRDNFLDAFAINAGVAVQLTNIIRDITSDYRRGRIYIPSEDLALAGLSGKSWLHDGEGMHKLLRGQCVRARSFHEAADAVFEKNARVGLFPARAMQNLYRTLLARIEEKPDRVLFEKIRLSLADKVKTIATTWIREFVREPAVKRS